MAAPPALTDISSGHRPPRLRLLAPLRYLSITHPAKTNYDVVIPLAFALIGWATYNALAARPPLFGDNGLLKYVRDTLVMAVPFMVGALAAVAMGAPGAYLDRRPHGAELRLDAQVLSMRQFVCYLLGYLCFVGLVTLGMAILADLLRAPAAIWVADSPNVAHALRLAGTLVLSLLLSALTVTVFWSLYFLTDVVNRSA